ncbi:N-acetylglucosamine 6-phosphate deacetylase [Paenibacillus taihuensis]|uniref:N-acetylglucosamine 6-phosphate deacetylase n=1 Tax=Paenibacillus taihuensis TaxID=1156355 RepID=A0A3D9S9Q4_9BACL|nr:N-acetylglucosamine-6-phosphate deacetylase [Paenibacillus taihuensis]REE86170.1 N-acetylglucosamine 6-phosphate deacetylase [Paenibacillus taihuensis]
MNLATKAYVNAQIYTGYELINGGGFITSGDGTIVSVGSPSLIESEVEKADRVTDLDGKIVLPGFVDVHVHGGGGYSLPRGEPEDFRGAAKYHAAHGTTSMLATTDGAIEPTTLGMLRNALQAQTDRTNDGADYIGVHLEGPFLNPIRKGAFDESLLHPPDQGEMERYIEASGGTIRLITVAPELAGGESFVKWLTAQGIRVSIGHSNATYEQSLQAIEWGARHTTHHFNGMSPFHHRDPGVAGAGMTQPSLTTELIADGIHVHPAAVRFLFDLKGAWNVCVITDAVLQAGLPDGDYGETVVSEGKIYLKGTETLAGSSATMLESLRRVLDYTGRSLGNVLPSITIVPAREAGADKRKGSLSAGLDADFLVLDEQLNLLETYVRGHRVYQKEE